MFDIGWGELVVIGIVALIVIGPRELPRTLRTVGQMMTKVRRMAGEFQSQFNEAIREAELDELRKEAEKLTNVTNPLGSFDDPLEKMKSEIRAAVEAPDKPETKPEPEAAPTAAPAAEIEADSAEKPAEPAADSAEGGGGRAA